MLAGRDGGDPRVQAAAPSSFRIAKQSGRTAVSPPYPAAVNARAATSLVITPRSGPRCYNQRSSRLRTTASLNRTPSATVPKSTFAATSFGQW